MKKILMVISTVMILTFVMCACVKQEPASQVIEVPKIIEQQVVGDAQSTISVNANETIKVAPDVAYINLGIVTKNTDVNAAQAENAEISANFLEAINKLGVTKEDVATANINIYEDYEIKGLFVVANTYIVTINDIKSIGSVIEVATNAGVNSTYSLSFDIKNKEKVYIEALTKAMESAKNKAESMADAAGYEIIKPQSISESGYAPSVYSNAAETAGKAEDMTIPVAPGEIEINAGINATYIIK